MIFKLKKHLYSFILELFETYSLNTWFENHLPCKQPLISPRNIRDVHIDWLPLLRVHNCWMLTYPVHRPHLLCALLPRPGDPRVMSGCYHLHLLYPTPASFPDNFHCCPRDKVPFVKMSLDASCQIRVEKDNILSRETTRSWIHDPIHPSLQLSLAAPLPGHTLGLWNTINKSELAEINSLIFLNLCFIVLCFLHNNLMVLTCLSTSSI